MQSVQTYQNLNQIANQKIKEAELLQTNGHFAGAYFLAGFAIECLLKAVISKSFQANTIPDKRLVNDIYSHGLDKLLQLASIKLERKNTVLSANWAEVSKWDSLARYQMVTQIDCNNLMQAILDKPDGVWQWLVSHL